ncbi:GbsR/MarR family transcriptional regulator [Chitinophaga japonensis]|uniref:Regulatory ArsR family protein n=1 Tax=Chitinophaga japonensis TaxID=104662 RepID=A0A562T778_CHIJA|nr:helix-turn-helix domain-containing protein [Chitinophaga japonensis]TWI89084.1 regulatory ArsR family protein [Chitinophaga japonensis]
MKKHEDKVEQYGLLLEKNGMSPVAARLTVYLMLHPEGAATFGEMVAYFKVSKSAVSNALRMLGDIGMVDYEMKTGSRKRYFYLNMDKWFSLDNVMQKYAMMQDMFEDLARSRKGRDKLSGQLKEAAGFFKMLQLEYPLLHKKWQKMRQP